MGLNLLNSFYAPFLCTGKTLAIHCIGEISTIERQITNISEGVYNKENYFFNDRHTHVIAV